MAETKRFPLDFDVIVKGTVIDAETIMGVTGVSVDSALYSGRQIGLCRRIEQELDDRGIGVTVICDGNDIRVVEDAEAATYNRAMFDKGLRRLKRSHRKLMQVDVNNLDADERQSYDRTLVIQGAVLAGVIAARREAIQIVHQRRNPGLPIPG